MDRFINGFLCTELQHYNLQLSYLILYSTVSSSTIQQNIQKASTHRSNTKHEHTYIHFIKHANWRCGVGVIRVGHHISCGTVVLDGGLVMIIRHVITDASGFAVVHAILSNLPHITLQVVGFWRGRALIEVRYSITILQKVLQVSWCMIGTYFSRLHYLIKQTE